MIDGVSLYLKKGFEKSHSKVDDQSTKVLQLKMVDLKSTVGMWTYGCYIKIKLTIPKKNSSKIYEAKEDYNQSAATGLAYAIHGVTRQIIDDPVIQDYILCR